MLAPRYSYLLLLTASGLLVGCAQGDLQPGVPGILPPALLVSPVVVEVEENNAEPGVGVAALGTLTDLEKRLPPRPPETAIRDLLPEETESLAAANSKLANLTELERQAVAQAAGNFKKTARLAALQQQLLCLRSIHERNQSASQALQAFYKLAEVRENGTTVESSLAQLGRMQDDLRKVKEQGLKVTADRTELDRKRLELQDQHSQLDLGDAQLSEQLRGLIGLNPGEPTRLVPNANLTLTVETIDVDFASSVGLQTRADLAALRLLLSELDRQTLPAARSSLSQTDPGLGVPAPSLGLLHKFFQGNTASCELDIRRAQLTELLENREQQVASEIRLAVREIETRFKQSAIASETLASWQQRLGNLKELREVGSATPLEIQQAQLEATAAEAALLKQVIAVRLAQVKLKEAQGLLAAECGYDIGTCLAGLFCP
ncbi:MAG: TolC family protein [Pirellulaceae bacterium]